MNRAPSPLRLYVRALQYFRPDVARIGVLLLLIGVGTLLGLLHVWPMAVLIDSVLTPNPRHGELYHRFLAPLGDNAALHVVALAAAVLALRLLQELLGAVQGLVSLRVGNRGLMRIRCELFEKLQALHLQYHRSQSQGDLIYRLTSDTCGIQSVLNVCIEVAVATITLAVMLAVMLTRSIELTLVALAVVPLLAGVNVWFGRLLNQHSRGAREVESRFTSVVQQSIASIGLSQAFGREAHESERFRQSAGQSLSAWLGFHGKLALYRLSVGGIFGGGGALIFGYGAWLVYRDQFLVPRPDGLTLGNLTVFLAYLGMFYDPLCKLTGAAANLQAGLTGVQRVFEVLDRPSLIEDAADARPLPRQPRTLVLAGVGFAYEPERPVLRGIDVAVPSGEMVALVGSSGVGKTTLLNLLPRFMDPTSGAMLLDGIDARRIRLRDLRRHVALVLQETLLLPTSVAENIAYGQPDASRAQVRRAAQLAGAEEFIDQLPDGFQTVVAEGGQNLSVGQRQRIAIARALLTEAPILVLDEPTSALDPQHEQQIVQTLRRLKGQRTIVLVSHRLSTVMDCDQVYVLHQGHVVSQGTHATLLARCRHYHDMARHQLGLADSPPQAIPAA